MKSPSSGTRGQIKHNRQGVCILHMENELLNPVKAVSMAFHAHAWTPPLVIIGTIKLFQPMATRLKAFVVVELCHLLV